MIILPWPDRILSPNSRTHWAQTAKASKKARNEAYWATMEYGYGKLTFAGYDGKLHLWIDFYAKTRNYPDADNCLSSMKGSIDGIADALGVNDRRFVFHPLVKEETIKGGRVTVRLTKDPLNHLKMNGLVGY